MPFGSDEGTQVLRSSQWTNSSVNLPARSITHNNLDKAFAVGETANSPARVSPRRNERDDDYGNPSEPSFDTPIDDIPWLFVACLIIAYIGLQEPSTSQDHRTRKGCSARSRADRQG